MSDKKMFLIVGLGNIGNEYDKTRHNTGFVVVDKIHEYFVFSEWKKLKYAFVSKGNIDGNDVLLAKPTTFMNLSGDAVLSLISFYKIPLSNVIVIQDDLDLDVGKMKIKVAGSSAGHNGIKDIDRKVGNNYKRVRIGIGHPRNIDPKIPVSDWVLSKFTPDDMLKIEETITELVGQIPEILKN